MLDLARARTFLVAVVSGQVIGTGTFEGDYVRSVFVLLTWHRKCIGKKIMQYLETVARNQGFRSIQLGSSITAMEFYLKLGYTLGAKSYNDQVVTTFHMTKAL
jgi:GNAT superfamily N-acetyltransferase